MSRRRISSRGHTISASVTVAFGLERRANEMLADGGFCLRPLNHPWCSELSGRCSYGFVVKRVRGHEQSDSSLIRALAQVKDPQTISKTYFPACGRVDSRCRPLARDDSCCHWLCRAVCCRCPGPLLDTLCPGVRDSHSISLTRTKHDVHMRFWHLSAMGQTRSQPRADPSQSNWSRDRLLL